VARLATCARALYPFAGFIAHPLWLDRCLSLPLTVPRLDRIIQGVTTHVAVKIKLMRFGKIRTPHYRIVIADARTARDSRAIEEIGRYNPNAEPSFIQVNGERAAYWLGVGAQPTEAVAAILKITGDWQKFKGLPGTEGTLRFAEPKPDKRIAYEAAVKDAMNEPADGATTAKKKAADKLAAKNAPVVETPVVETPVVETPVVETPVVETPVVETPVVETPVVETPVEEVVPVVTEVAAVEVLETVEAAVEADVVAPVEAVAEALVADVAPEASAE
jgi:small subunit ribosomal protein S16